jgi:hypothetical protein
MQQDDSGKRFPTVGDGSGLSQVDTFYREEVQLALRNKGMPVEAQRYPITPVGMHYLLVHFDIPEVEAVNWHLNIHGLVARPTSLTLDDIEKRPSATLPVTLECAGSGGPLGNKNFIKGSVLTIGSGTVLNGYCFSFVVGHSGQFPNSCLRVKSLCRHFSSCSQEYKISALYFSPIIHTVERQSACKV